MFIEGDQGDCLVVDEFLADILCNLVFQTLQHTLPRVEHFIKLRVRGVCTIQQQPYSFSKLLCLQCTYHSATVWGEPYSFSKLLCLGRTYHSTTVLGKPYSFSKLLCSRHTYHSKTVWGKPYSFSILLRMGCA